MPMGPGSPPKHYIDSGLTMQDRFVVLRLFTSAAYRPSPGTNFSVPAADCCTRFSKIGLLQKPPARLPTNLTQRLLSEQNAAARLIFRILQSEHIPQRSSASTGCASQNVSTSNWQLWRFDPSMALLRLTYTSCFTRVADMTFRRRQWSSTSLRLDVPLVRLSTVDKRAFPVSGATGWNDLPLHVASAPSAPSLAVFKQRLKTFLFPVPTKTLSYGSCVTITIHHYCLDTCGPCNN